MLLLSAREQAGAGKTEALFARVIVGAGAVLALLGSAVSVLKEFTNVL